MYVKSIYKYLSLKDLIRIASFDLNLRKKLFKNKPTWKQIKPYIYDIKKIHEININFFNGDIEKFNNHYKLIEKTIQHGYINLFKYLYQNEKTNTKIEEYLIKSINNLYTCIKGKFKKCIKLHYPKISIPLSIVHKNTRKYNIRNTININSILNKYLSRHI